MNQLQNQLQEAEKALYEQSRRVAKLRKETKPIQVKNYTFQNLDGEVSLLELFGDKDTLFLIHNMGQGCRYCTLWADGFNAFVTHLESQFSFVLASKDDPQTQRLFSNSRNWRMRMVSHGGGDYIKEQAIVAGENNMPGMVCYIRKGDQIFRKNATGFGPGDEFCPHWNILSMAGVSVGEWIPQFNYWKRPEQLDDGGNGIIL